MNKSVNLTLSLDNMKELKDALQESINELEDGTIFMTKEKLKEVLQKRKNILSGIESAIIHAEMEG